MKFKWEEIFYTKQEGDIGCSTGRAKVPGGWLINNIMWGVWGNSYSTGLIFIEDKQHEWEIDKE